MDNNNKIKKYTFDALFHSPDFQKLFSFLLDAMIGIPCVITSKEIHGAFECLKAQDKLNIEQNAKLSDIQKEFEIKSMESFYDNIEMKLIEDISKKCSPITVISNSEYKP